MKYEPIIPPISLNFESLKKDDLNKYKIWFLDIMQHRESILEEAVKSTKGFESWHADHSENSLLLLGEWFKENVSLRPRTQAELNQIKSKEILFADEYSKNELTEITFSLSFDVAIYTSNTLIQNRAGLRWTQVTDHRDNIDFGHVVLAGFGRLAFNPTLTIITLAYGIAKGSRTGSRLNEIYLYWKNKT